MGAVRRQIPIDLDVGEQETFGPRDAFETESKLMSDGAMGSVTADQPLDSQRSFATVSVAKCGGHAVRGLRQANQPRSPIDVSAPRGKQLDERLFGVSL